MQIFILEGNNILSKLNIKGGVFLDTTKLQNLRKTIHMTNDSFFKAMIKDPSSKDILSSVLSILLHLPKKEFEHMKITGGEIPKQNQKEKGKVSDIIIYLNHLDLIIILEMNQQNTLDIFEKNSEYANKIAFLSTKRIETRYIYKKVILINFNCFNKKKVKTAIQYFTVNDQNQVIETKKGYQSIHLNLDKIIDTRYNGDIDEKLIRYAKYLTAEGIENIKKCAEGDEELMKTIPKVEEYLENENEIGYYDYEENKQRLIDGSYFLGEEVGLERGREEGQKIIIQSLAKNMTISEISKASGMSEKSILSLLES